MSLLYSLASVVLFALSLYTLLTSAHLLRKILAINIMSSAVFLFFISMAGRAPETLPDPVPHALVLTGIVVTLSATAFALALARRIHGETGHTRLPHQDEG